MLKILLFCFSFGRCFAGLFGVFTVLLCYKTKQGRRPKEQTMTKKSVVTPKTYNYEWKTAEEVIANIHTVVKFQTFGIGSVAEKTGVTEPETYRKAHELWLKLKDAFNAEASTYNPDAYDSKLGSVGKVERREVLRSAWWDELSEYSEEEYCDITSIIEILHHGEKLETGTIIFGS